MQKFLGRRYDDKTNTWVFSDGSGRLPDEMRIEVIQELNNFSLGGFNGLNVLSKLFSWKDRLIKPAERDGVGEQ